jgi:hypothetical protein
VLRGLTDQGPRGSLQGQYPDGPWARLRSVEDARQAGVDFKLLLDQLNWLTRKARFYK